MQGKLSCQLSNQLLLSQMLLCNNIELTEDFPVSSNVCNEFKFL